MRSPCSTKVLALVVVLASPAFAQASFAPWSLGLGANFFGVPGNPYLVWAGGAQFEGSRYLDSGFELIAHIGGAFVQQPAGFGSDGSRPGSALALTGRLGFRWLMLEEDVRPSIGLHLASVGVFQPALGANSVYVGPGASIGVDFFVAESVSLGARGTFDVFITLNQPVLFCPGGGVNVTVSF